MGCAVHFWKALCLHRFRKVYSFPYRSQLCNQFISYYIWYKTVWSIISNMSYKWSKCANAYFILHWSSNFIRLSFKICSCLVGQNGAAFTHTTSEPQCHSRICQISVIHIYKQGSISVLHKTSCRVILQSFEGTWSMFTSFQLFLNLTGSCWEILLRPLPYVKAMWVFSHILE